jgi:hypothetical protein
MRLTPPSFIEMELRSGNRPRHWSPSSQTYAPVDVLLESMADDWSVNPMVGLEEYWYGGGRHVAVYYFELTKDGRAVSMPVLGNPIVRRLVGQRPFRVMLLSFDDAMSIEEAVEAPHLQQVAVESGRGGMTQHGLPSASTQHAIINRW